VRQFETPRGRSASCSHLRLLLRDRVGYGDVCPGQLGWEGRIFLVVYALGCIGFFCGPVLEILSSTWRSHLPGGVLALASFVLAAGVAIFTWEGYSQSEALYASVIVGTPLLLH
jgi:hypothetical protein